MHCILPSFPVLALVLPILALVLPLWWHIGKSNDGTEKRVAYISVSALLLAICQNTKKLGDATAISKSETINDSLTHSLTGVGARRCYLGGVNKIVKCFQ